ncbi:MAG: hypothetical protein KGJ07_06040 [Patescibacteria group bacterium]|nr:hypothetical protein [Patescibacteria group bacterium]MDE2589279.1 hypothetical protein [Patescibacteria group bacterium]
MDEISQQTQYNELAYYTLSHNDPQFIHQHIVDAFTAQTADEHTKPIAIAFALVGLYLFLEKNFTGKQVQQTHIVMAKKKREWPKFDLPQKRGDITVMDVLNVSPGPERDDVIRKWCKSVWEAYTLDHQKVSQLFAGYK